MLLVASRFEAGRFPVAFGEKKGECFFLEHEIQIEMKLIEIVSQSYAKKFETLLDLEKSCKRVMNVN